MVAQETKTKIFIILVLICAGFFCIQNVLADEKININTATLEELDTLPGIGPAKAQAIIDYRETNGSFQAIEEIINVSGIGSTTFENIKDSITVGAEEEASGEPRDPVAEFIPHFDAGLHDDNYNLGDVVINEFVSDPADGEVEFIELYNTTGQTIDLTGWSIEEGSGAKTNMEGEIGFSGDDKFFVIEKPKGNLNNKGDIIILRDAYDNLIDQVAYGEWDDGSIENNAPVAKDPKSTARKVDGQNSSGDADDFALTALPTKGKSNVIQEGLRGMAGNGAIIISEILPDPIGVDAYGEFIELYNASEEKIYLSGWRIENENDMELEFSKGKIIGPNEYLVIYRKESGLVLNNKGGKIKLFKPEENKASQIVKFKNADEGYSYNYQDGEWLWSDKITPGQENIVSEINNLPLVEFYYSNEILAGRPSVFDASDTIDEDGDNLIFSWDFGDGFKNNLQNPEHTYFNEGNYKVRLIVNDGKDEARVEKIIRVTGVLNSGVNYSGQDSDEVIINEIFPNPVGSDAGEWIEIKNESDNEVNLINWSLDDGEGGSRPYEFTDNIWIGPDMYYLVNRAESKIVLNNTSDRARLFNKMGELINEIKYEGVFEGESYARGENGEWFWTTVLTPGDENFAPAFNAGAGSEIWEIDNAPIVSSAIFAPAITNLENIKELNKGDLAVVNGIVAVIPGVFSSQYFYIIEDGYGIQVYSYKKIFPVLKVGDYIEVMGELSEARGEKRIKIKQKENIIILENKDNPAPEEISCGEISEEFIGSLVKISGEIVERKSRSLYIDDGADEALVYLKKPTNIDPKIYDEGDYIQATGIVSRTKSGIRIMPRSGDDIIKKNIESYGSNEGRVLGEAAEDDEWAIKARDKKIELFKYLLVIAGAVIILLGGLLTKAVIKSRK